MIKRRLAAVMAFGLFKKKKKETKENIPSGFLKLKVNKVVKETADAVSIHFEQPEDGRIFYKAGQYFTIMVNINGKDERRSYSLCSSPYTDELPAVGVKRVEGGLVSNYLNSEVKAGDELLVVPPMGNFTTEFTTANDRHLVLFGGGSGITPLISIAKSALSQEPNTKVTLVYANRNEDSIIFKSEIESLSANEQFEVKHVLESIPAGWSGFSGRISQPLIEQVLASVDVAKIECFTCGPAPMMDVVLDSLAALGVDSSRVHKESFVSTKLEENKKESAEELVAREVTVILDDEEYKFTVNPDESILEKGLDEGLNLPFSCQSGLCTSCRGKCLSGKVKMDESEGLTEAELEEGFVLPCVAHPLTDDVKIEIG
ncbi:2Fe-2S iron-sulfur cluster-binding protein [Roseivirga pacifica]|uniref:2Fe-2S iron-sulfur cluster-binding protein n=1 Tax=Roseivirga pacifica TaxID=1267423 RepID=UPI003BAB9C68